MKHNRFTIMNIIIQSLGAYQTIIPKTQLHQQRLHNEKKRILNNYNIELEIHSNCYTPIADQEECTDTAIDKE